VGQLGWYAGTAMSAACLTAFPPRVTCYQLDAVSQSQVEWPNWVNRSVFYFAVCGMLCASAPVVDSTEGVSVLLFDL